jgi:vesicle coat complex subunit
MKLMEMMEQNSEYVTVLIKKLSPPLVTLLSAEPEIQYVALRNITLLVQKRFFGYLPSLSHKCTLAFL